MDIGHDEADGSLFIRFWRSPPCRAYRLLPHLADTDSHGSTYMITPKFRGRKVCCQDGAMWGPPVISWFRFAPVTIVINTMNHSYWTYLHQLSYLGGLTLYRWYYLPHISRFPPAISNNNFAVATKTCSLHQTNWEQIVNITYYDLIILMIWWYDYQEINHEIANK